MNNCLSLLVAVEQLACCCNVNHTYLRHLFGGPEQAEASSRSLVAEVGKDA